MYYNENICEFYCCKALPPLVFIQNSLSKTRSQAVARIADRRPTASQQAIN